MENIQNNNFQKYLDKLKQESADSTSKVVFPQFDNSITPKLFLKAFILQYKIIYEKSFDMTEESKFLICTLYYYFFRKDNFYKSPLVYVPENSKPSLDKGLAIIGGCGTGKTSIVKTFVEVIKNISLNHQEVPVRMHNSLDIVHEYQKTQFEHRTEVIDKYSAGFRIFDDVKNEPEALNFGKSDIMSDILYIRCEARNFKTIILCNYDSIDDKNMKQAIESFDRYGDRVYDRFFEAFNFIQLTSLSMRK
jgi:DNA replication protein DnaC